MLQSDAMPKAKMQPPSPDASPQAHAIYAFMLRRGLTAYRWTRDAGVPKNILRQLFAAKTNSLDYPTLVKLAVAASCTVPSLTGEPADEGRLETIMTGEGPGFRVLEEVLREQQRTSDLMLAILRALESPEKRLNPEVSGQDARRENVSQPGRLRLPKPS